MEDDITLTIKISPKLYKTLKSEAMTYFLAHAGNPIMIVSAWGYIFKQVDKCIQEGSKEATAYLRGKNEADT